MTPVAIDAVIMVTQTPDFRAPSTAIHVAHRLGCSTDVLAFDIALGCSGFVYGLNNAFALVNGGLENVLLLVGDVASRFAAPDDRAFAPLMGDAGAAALVTRQPTSSHFCLHSDGAGYRSLYLPGSGVREETDGFRRPGYMYMNGAEVFNFTIKVVPSMFTEIFDYAQVTPDAIDFYLLHQPNKYILHNIRKRLNLPSERVPDQTQAIYGNQNSASIPGTLNGFLSADLHQAGKKKLLFAGFGIGLSWGAAVTEVNNLYAPPVIIDERN
jgi:3-oxoacyl-[acyl-carrier-protein] synthase-3